MAADNSRPVYAFAVAIDKGDVEAAVEVCDPEIEFRSVFAIDGRAYVGHAGIRQYFVDVATTWDTYHMEVHRVVGGRDGRVAIIMTMHVRGRGSGVAISDPTGHVWTLRNGRLLRNRVYREPTEALAAINAA
jgi:ketosteroid isomerase-like protein